MNKTVTRLLVLCCFISKTLSGKCKKKNPSCTGFLLYILGNKDQWHAPRQVWTLICVVCSTRVCVCLCVWFAAGFTSGVVLQASVYPLSILARQFWASATLLSRSPLSLSLFAVCHCVLAISCLLGSVRCIRNWTQCCLSSFLANSCYFWKKKSGPQNKERNEGVAENEWLWSRDTEWVAETVKTVVPDNWHDWPFVKMSKTTYVDFYLISNLWGHVYLVTFQKLLGSEQQSLGSKVHALCTTMTTVVFTMVMVVYNACNLDPRDWCSFPLSNWHCFFQPWLHYFILTKYFLCLNLAIFNF